METSGLEGAPAELTVDQARRPTAIELGEFGTLGPVAEELLATALQPAEAGEQHEDQQQRQPKQALGHGTWVGENGIPPDSRAPCTRACTSSTRGNPVASHNIGYMLWLVKPGRVLISLSQRSPLLWS